MKRQFFVLAAVIISSIAQAQDSTGKVLDEAVVTANKFEQKQSQTGNVGWLDRLLNRDEIRPCRLCRWRQPLFKLAVCHDPSWQQRIDPNSVNAILPCQGFGHSQQPCLRRDIAGHLLGPD